MYTLGGSVTGLAGTGLILGTNGQSIAVPAPSTSFAFPDKLHTDDSYNVQVLDYPSSPIQLCAISAGGVGTIGNADISNIFAGCANADRIEVAIGSSPLTGTGLVLLNNGGDPLVFSAPAATGAMFDFHTPVSAANASYNITVQTNPVSP
jgi:trimeric autotransporter adhesin